MDKLNEYKILKKTKSEIAADEIVQNIHNKLWNESGYTTIYRLGSIIQLKAMVESIKYCGSYTKADLLRMIALQKTCDDVSDEIKNLVNDILEEFDYEEN
jgi:hypothetical protein